MLSVALYGCTAKEWRDNNRDKKGNIRDYSSLQQLLVLANMESYNATLIDEGKVMSERLKLLRKMAIRQMETDCKQNASFNASFLYCRGIQN